MLRLRRDGPALRSDDYRSGVDPPLAESRSSNFKITRFSSNVRRAKNGPISRLLSANRELDCAGREAAGKWAVSSDVS